MGVSLIGMCELISRYNQYKHQLDYTPEQILEAHSPHGELVDIIFAYWQAKAHYEGKSLHIDGVGNITFVDNPPSPVVVSARAKG